MFSKSFRFEGMFLKNKRIILTCLSCHILSYILEQIPVHGLPVLIKQPPCPVRLLWLSPVRIHYWSCDVARSTRTSFTIVMGNPALDHEYQIWNMGNWSTREMPSARAKGRYSWKTFGIKAMVVYKLKIQLWKWIPHIECTIFIFFLACNSWAHLFTMLGWSTVTSDWFHYMPWIMV